MLHRVRCRFWRNETGVSAIEFGLVAPMLALGLTLMLDIGLAVGQRMELDRNVRAGVQAAMSNISDLDAVRNLVLSTSEDPDALTVSVNRTCSCSGVATPCTQWCAVDSPPNVFVNISAVKDFTGVMLPTFALDSSTHVQLR